MCWGGGEGGGSGRGVYIEKKTKSCCSSADPRHKAVKECRLLLPLMGARSIPYGSGEE